MFTLQQALVNFERLQLLHRQDDHVRILFGVGSCFHILRSLHWVVYVHRGESRTTELAHLETNAKPFELVPMDDMGGDDSEFNIRPLNVFLHSWEYQAQVSRPPLLLH